MKSYSLLLIAITVLLIGCESSSNLLVDSQVSKSTSAISKSFDYELIPLPQKSPVWQDSVFTVSKEINGIEGGNILLEKYYVSATGDSVIIEADLRIPEGAFQDTRIITMTVDDEYAVINFYPEMVFIDTLKLFQSFRGLNLENFSTETLDFAYMDDDGTAEIIKKNGLQIVINSGLVRVQNAKLIHFSRYGWIKKTCLPIHTDPVVEND